MEQGTTKRVVVKILMLVFTRTILTLHYKLTTI